MADKAVFSWVTNAFGHHVGLYWKYCHTHGFVCVFADHPQIGETYMGTTKNEAKACAKACNWHKDVTKLARLQRGQRVIVDDEFLNSIADSDEASLVASCHNRHRCGIHDGFVAWIGEENKPHDLEFRADMTAVGSL